jgi:hypothetical protein
LAVEDFVLLGFCALLKDMAFWMRQVGQATQNSSPGHEEREAKSEGKGSLLLVDVDFVNGLV